MASRIPLKDRIRNLISKENGCWLWQGRITYQGYGQSSTGYRTEGNRKTRPAHVVSYEAFIGKVPKGLVLDHLCRNRACVNPGHLEPVTIQENIRRGELHLVNGGKTHCPQGHEYTLDNLYASSTKNGRNCKACMKARSRQRYWATKGILYHG